MSSNPWDQIIDLELARAIAQSQGWAQPDIRALLDAGRISELFEASRQFDAQVREWIETHEDEAAELRREVAERVVAEHEQRIDERLADLERGRVDREVAALRRFLVDAGVGERTADVVCESVEPTEPMRAAREWVQARESGTLLLLGTKGTGKTVAAAWAMAEAASTTTESCLCDACHGHAEVQSGCLVGAFHRARIKNIARRKRAMFSKAGHLASALHRTGGDEVWERARRCHVLVIDDLGREYADQHGRWHAELDLLIDDRHEAMRPTIVTANLTAAEFRERYGERIADRIRQDGRVVVCSGESLRARRGA